MTTLRNIKDMIKNIEAIPASAAKAIRLLQTPETNISEIIGLIEYDPTLTADILKLANSSLFSPANPICSIQEASVRIGDKNLLCLLISASMADLLKRPLEGYELPALELWNHSVCTSVCVNVLEKKLSLHLPEYAFTAAILHDVGKIILGSFVKVNASEIIKLAESNNLTFPEAERKCLGTDHAEVGAMLLSHWNLPEELERPVRWHHQPEKCPSTDKSVTDIVHVADGLTLLKGVGAGIDGLKYRLADDIFLKYGLDVNSVESVICETQTKFVEIMKAFSG